jgi:hypothetical protein
VAVSPKVAAETEKRKQARQATPTKQDVKADTAVEQKKRVKKKRVKPAEVDEGKTKADAKKQPDSGAKQRKRPSTLKKQAVKKKAVSAQTKGNGSTDSDTPQKKAVHKPASNVTNFPLRKKTARRGIRLK